MMLVMSFISENALVVIELRRRSVTCCSQNVKRLREK